MAKNYYIKNAYGQFGITLFKGADEAVCFGNKKACSEEFKKIQAKAPNKYGNFYKREKAGHNACIKILKNNNLI